MKLTPKQIKFVNEYCVDENGTQAAIRAGYSKETAGQIASQNLKRPAIKEAILERKEELVYAAKITPEWVVAQWSKIAGADPNDLVQIKKTCCRYCHGADHHYQWTQAEYEHALNDALDNQKAPPDGIGGFGYNADADPNPNCPECAGNGITDVHVADTRKLNARSKILYNGAERTRNGIKINMRDRDAAVNNLARYLGMLVDKKELSGPNGGPISMTHLSADDLTDDQLAAILQVNDDVADEG